MDIRQHLLAGQVIPAQPLALDAARRFSEKHQRAITRYYLAAGVGGLAVGVHSTQFEIRDPKHNLFKPVLELAASTVREELAKSKTPRDVLMIAGVCGRTGQALREAELAKSLGYQAALVSMAAWGNAPEDEITAHMRELSRVIPIIGFYLQPSVGGRVFSIHFWRRIAEIENLLAVKIAPFNRYQTLDVIRAIIETGRDDVALYTGNDDTIVTDLLTPFTFEHNGRRITRRIAGGLLGHWGVWTRAAVSLFGEIKLAAAQPTLDAKWLARASAVTDMNAAVFDAANKFAGCIPGILEVLRRQGLTETAHCLNPHEVLSPGQAEELTRVARMYPELTDDAFIAQHRAGWLR